MQFMRWVPRFIDANSIMLWIQWSWQSTRLDFTRAHQHTFDDNIRGQAAHAIPWCNRPSLIDHHLGRLQQRKPKEDLSQILPIFLLLFCSAWTSPVLSSSWLRSEPLPWRVGHCDQMVLVNFRRERGQGRASTDLNGCRSIYPRHLDQHPLHMELAVHCHIRLFCKGQPEPFNWWDIFRPALSHSDSLPTQHACFERPRPPCDTKSQAEDLHLRMMSSSLSKITSPCVFHMLI